MTLAVDSSIVLIWSIAAKWPAVQASLPDPPRGGRPARADGAGAAQRGATFRKTVPKRVSQGWRGRMDDSVRARYGLRFVSDARA